MEKLTDEKFSAGLESFQKMLTTHTPKILNTEIKIKGSYRNLLAPENAKVVALSKDVREFRFRGPAYLRRIDVLCPEPDRILEYLSLEVVTIGGEKIQLQGKKAVSARTNGVQEFCVRYQVGKVCGSVRAKSIRPFLKLEAKGVEVFGYTIEQLDFVAKKVSETLTIAEQIQTYVAEKSAAVSSLLEKQQETEESNAELEKTNEKLETEKKTVASAVADESEQFRTLVARKQELDSSLSAARIELEAIRNNQLQLSAGVESLNRVISNKREELAHLENDRSLISDEYQDYVREGGRQTVWYVGLLLCTLAIMAFAVYQIYTGANRILTSEVATYKELAVLVLQRLPFVSALALVVTVCWRLASSLISRVMKIHAQRLALARLLVIAKDTVYSSMAGLGLSDEFKFRERIRLKVAMLKSHLTAELGRDFTYPEQASQEASLEEAKVSSSEAQAEDEQTSTQPA